jgi:hypothetical protein
MKFRQLCGPSCFFVKWKKISSRSFRMRQLPFRAHLCYDATEMEYKREALRHGSLYVLSLSLHDSLLF